MSYKLGWKSQDNNLQDRLNSTSYRVEGKTIKCRFGRQSSRYSLHNLKDIRCRLGLHSKGSDLKDKSDSTDYQLSNNRRLSRSGR